MNVRGTDRARAYLDLQEAITEKQAARLLGYFDSAPSAPARVSRKGQAGVHRGYRRTSSLLLDPKDSGDVVDLFETWRSTLEEFYGERLGPCQPPTFLCYGPGDYFTPHCDNNDGRAGEPLHIRARRAAAILLLNSPAAQATRGASDTFEGGELILYYTDPEPDWDNFFITVPAGARTLVSFSADILHEVTPVTMGVRYSIVTWFERPRAD